MLSTGISPWAPVTCEVPQVAVGELDGDGEAGGFPRAGRCATGTSQVLSARPLGLHPEADEAGLRGGRAQLVVGGLPVAWEAEHQPLGGLGSFASAELTQQGGDFHRVLDNRRDGAVVLAPD